MQNSFFENNNNEHLIERIFRSTDFTLNETILLRAVSKSWCQIIEKRILLKIVELNLVGAKRFDVSNSSSIATHLHVKQLNEIDCLTLGRWLPNLARLNVRGFLTRSTQPLHIANKGNILFPHLESLHVDHFLVSDIYTSAFVGNSLTELHLGEHTCFVTRDTFQEILEHNPGLKQTLKRLTLNDTSVRRYGSYCGVDLPLLELISEQFQELTYLDIQLDQRITRAMLLKCLRKLSNLVELKLRANNCEIFPAYRDYYADSSSDEDAYYETDDDEEEDGKADIEPEVDLSLLFNPSEEKEDDTEKELEENNLSLALVPVASTTHKSVPDSKGQLPHIRTLHLFDTLDRDALPNIARIFPNITELRLNLRATVCDCENYFTGQPASAGLCPACRKGNSFKDYLRSCFSQLQTILLVDEVFLPFERYYFRDSDEDNDGFSD